MWSLYKAKECEPEGIFNYSTNGDELKPLVFSNNKTQEDVVKEILDAINSGEKIIFIRGVCGTGKSAIALNLAKYFKKTSIVVPIKSLQKQYEEDYTNDKFILKDNKEKLKISVIKGRNNFSCPFLTSQGEHGSADNEFLPCTIELKEKNMDQVKKYIEMNPNVDKYNFSTISDVRRMSIAPVCPHWSPLLPADLDTKALEKAKRRKYMAICGKEFAVYERKTGCQYYDQYHAYIDSDVLIFNSMKYIIETAMGRKPKTDLEIIDECDEFLDSFANEETINLNRLVFALSNLFPDTAEKKQAIKQLIKITNELMFEEALEIKDQIKKIGETKTIDLIKLILENPSLAEDEEENYYNRVFEIAKTFEHFLTETYISFVTSQSNITTKQTDLFGKTVERNQENVFLNLVTINLAKKFQQIIDANNVLVLMSGTLHSEQVLKDIFGLDHFKIIEAETITPGTITKYRTGLEKNCKYANFKDGTHNRKDYLKSLSVCLANAKPPTLIHVSSFGDLPSELEKSEYQLDNLISKEELIQLQRKHKGKEIDKFKQGEFDALFTTKCSRGVDFPGEKCNSIVLTKYPYPNIQSLFWKILRQEQPDKFLEFYLDKANRELLQKIYRGLRFKQDHIILLSPDERVLNARLK